MTPSEIQELLNQCAACPRLTPWEEDFLDSVTEQFETHGGLSVNQISKLQEILEQQNSYDA